MKKIATIFLIIVSFQAFAQTNNIHEFGNVSIEDLKMKFYEKDSSANALYLLNSGYVFINSGQYNQSSLTFHKRIKIFNKAAFEIANIKIPYYDGNGFSELKAQTIWLDDNGQIKRRILQKNDFVFTNITGDLGQLHFSFPELKEGCVIEYTYTLPSHTSYFITSWDFQLQYPVVNSQFSYEVDGLENLTAVIHGLNISNENTLIQKFNHVKMYSVTNLPAWIDEPFCSSKYDYMDRLNFYFRSAPENENWNKISYEMMGNFNFGYQLDKSEYLLKIANKLCDKANANTPFEKMITIRNHVANWFTWNHEYADYCKPDLYKVYDSKIGTSGEINFVMMNMLENMGLTIHPAILRTKSSGKPFLDIPNERQFNHVLAVVTIDNNQYVLDATSKLSWNILPIEFADRDLVIIDSKNAKVVQIEASNNFSITSKTNISILENGDLKYTISKKFEDYAKESELKKIKEISNKEYIEAQYKNPEIQIDSFNLNNYLIDSIPLETSVSLTVKNELKNNMNLIYINFNSLNSFTNPFISTKRLTDIDFGYTQLYEDKVNFNIPVGYSIIELPEEANFTSADGTMVFAKNVITTDTQIKIRYSVEINRKIYSASKYSEVQKFYNNCQKEFSSSIIFKKNKG